MKKIILLVGVSLFCCAVRGGVAGESERQRFVVVRVSDGDTLKGVVNYKYQTIRIAGIDCPENRVNSKVFEQMEEFGADSKDELLKKGKEAREKLRKLLEFYEEEIYFVRRDDMVCKYGNGKRMVGDLFAGKINVSEYMLKEGGCIKKGCRKK